MVDFLVKQRIAGLKGNRLCCYTTDIIFYKHVRELVCCPEHVNLYPFNFPKEYRQQAQKMPVNCDRTSHR
jgi:hypothetical protein